MKPPKPISPFEELNQAYNAGKKARKLGISLDKNPFMGQHRGQRGQTQECQWARGWLAGTK